MTTSPAPQRGGASAIETLTLQSGRQRLSVLPTLGASVAAWDLQWRGQWTPLFRPWAGSSDLYTTACFPLVPWSNRISEGGFMHKGMHYPVLQNRAGENYPIHGDGWLQAWQAEAYTDNSVVLTLNSEQYDGDPYTYSATQTLTLHDDGLEIDLQVTNRGADELPFGLGLHPYFPRNAATRLQSRADGVWLCGADPIPTEHTQDFPATFDYNRLAAVDFPFDGPLIDNCFTGWDGVSRIDYPDRGLRIEMRMEDCNGYSLMYRPPGLDYFCLEPITHPIDAFHMPGRPGLVDLQPGASMRLLTHFKVNEL
ncbi:galactose mutarotase-like enzyme [Herbaspirillum sp. CF444]|uniref:aldose 1-epimerase n=1 Tax=Herbaspirillum sp. CF444 TaxID=1144319 RepID=UPI0002725D34|nr:aldose 1-epimerase [Herbaspirillum sp. CF444]EJL92749.1 galactose mutarotase-like enzyme [Herbaspirillum sp. CF444]